MSSLKDGLGGEQLQASGLQVGGAGISPYLAGSLTSASTLQGANVIATTTISGVNAFATTLSGTSVLGTTVRGATVSGAVFSGTSFVDSTGLVKSASLGSPAAYGARLQCGSGATSAGSLVWQVFGTAFAQTPTVVASPVTSMSGLNVPAGSVALGSFFAFSEGASQAFNWVALGI